MEDREGRVRNGELDGVSLVRFEGVAAIALRHGLLGRADMEIEPQDREKLNEGVGTSAGTVGVCNSGVQK
jgi:hypothetical protein